MYALVIIGQPPPARSFFRNTAHGSYFLHIARFCGKVMGITIFYVRKIHPGVVLRRHHRAEGYRFRKASTPRIAQMTDRLLGIRAWGKPDRRPLVQAREHRSRQRESPRGNYRVHDRRAESERRKCRSRIRAAVCHRDEVYRDCRRLVRYGLSPADGHRLVRFGPGRRSPKRSPRCHRGNFGNPRGPSTESGG